jgi:hypothetical protein
VSQDANSDIAIRLDDIRLDAIRVKERRERLNHLGLL